MIVYITKASRVEKKQSEDIDRYAWFSEEYLKYHKMIQHVWQSTKDCRAISFSGKIPVPDSEEPNAEEK